MALEQWAPRALDQSIENPSKTIQLASDGLIWETWATPFPPVDEWLSQARAVMAAFAEECPKKRVPLLFTALNAAGEISTQCPSSVMGKNAQADAMVGAGGGTAKAFADAMVGIVATMNAVNKAAKEMVENVTAANRALTEQIVDLREFAEATQDAALAEKKSEGTMNEFLVQQLKDASPLALEALGMFLESHKQKTIVGAAKAVVTGINQINGVSP